MKTAPATARKAALAALVLVVAAAAFIALTGSEQREVSADFAGTGEMQTGDPVRIDGVDIGKVTALAPRDDRRATRVTMSLDRDDIVLMRDARADLRAKTLFGGNSYVDLNPGSPATGRAATSVIPLERTTTQVTFDDLLQPLDGQTSARLQTTLKEFGTGLSDPGAVRDVTDEAAPALAAVGRGLRPLSGGTPGDLPGLIRSTARVTRALSADDPALERLVVGAARTLQVTDRRQNDLRRTLVAAPAALKSTTATGRRLDRTFAKLDPLAAELRPGARRLEETARRARPVLNSATDVLTRARPLLQRLRPALSSLASLSRRGETLVRALDPSVKRFDEDLLPWLNEKDKTSGRTTAQMIGPTFSAASSSTTEFDGSGFWIRFPAIFGERPALSAPCSTFLTDPTADQKVRCDELESLLAGVLGGKP